MEAFMRLVHFSIKQHKRKFFLNATKTDKDLSIQKMYRNKNKNGIES